MPQPPAPEATPRKPASQSAKQYGKAGCEVARLQMAITLCVVVLAALSGLWWWPHSPAIAVMSAAFWLMGYTLLLGLEFVLMYQVNRHDSAPRAHGLSLLQAWWTESRVAAQVFAWRQPFRAQAVPDQLDGSQLHGQRGVVFIHGLFCNRGFWTPWLRRLHGSRHAYIAVSLEPALGSIDNYVAQIDQAVTRVTQVSGLPPLLVCHSMGGLAARAWLTEMHGSERVFKVVTLGTPHHGTWLARFGRSLNGQQMRQNSDWLTCLNSPAQAVEMPWQARFVCWYSNCDNIVFPTSTATLPGADNRLVCGAAHVQLAFVASVMDATLALLETPRVNMALS